jgi:hypothetical protein
MKKNNARIGSEPSKENFGNTPDRPDNIKESAEQPKEKIARGAHQSNLKTKKPKQ